jgi:recombination protein RecA
MKSQVVKADLESALGSRFGLACRLQERPAPETISTGIREVDVLTGGLPRGAITEICGPVSSGRTSLLISILAGAAMRQEVCAVVDVSDTLDPESAAAAGVNLDRLLWIRCAGRIEHALQAADWLLQGGGFGIVAMDLADVPPLISRRIPLASWFRLRRAIENTPAVLLVIEQEPHAKSCSSLILETTKERIAWAGAPNPQGAPSHLLLGAAHRLQARKPVRSAPAIFESRLWNKAAE